MDARGFRAELLRMETCVSTLGVYVSTIGDLPLKVYADARGASYRSYDLFGFYAGDFAEAAAMAWRHIAALESRRICGAANVGEGDFVKYPGRV